MAESKSTKSTKPAAKNPSGYATKKKTKYVGVKVAMYHPFAKVRIPTGSPGVEFETVDSWLQSQIDRGLIKAL